MLFVANIVVNKSHLGHRYDCTFHIYTLLMYTNTHDQSKLNSLFTLRHQLLKEAFYTNVAHKRPGSCCRPNLEQLIDVCSC